MHYYQHHIGDFIRDTSRLTDSQCMAYMRMLWMYYESEQPMPNNTRSIAFKLGAEQEVVELILEAYFKLDGDVWRHTRCDKEIAEYQAICERNKTNGKAGGRPKKTQSVSTGDQQEFGSEPSRNPIQYPLTNNQEDISSGSTTIPTIPASASPDQPVLKLVSKTIPDCPHADILTLWAEKLPAAIQPADWNEKRQQALRSRWREKANRQKLDWWARFFEYIAQSDFLMGRTNTPGRKAFALSLDWLCKSENFLKVIEGRFHEQEAVAV